jgi:uncharacterized delta-60 repeat protein
LTPQAVLNPQTAVSFASSSVQVLTNPSNNFLNATFNVSNTSGGALSDLTLVAYHKTGNRVNTAVKNLQNFNALSSAALDAYAVGVKPTNGMTSATTVNANLADLQLFTETEVTGLTTEAGALLSGGEYLFPYGYVARTTGSTSNRSIANGSNTGTLTVGIKVPTNNEPSSAVYRFSMTFLVFTTPTATRVSESLEEQGTGSGAEARGGAAGFNVDQIAVLAGSAPSTSKDVVNACRVRTAGTTASPSAFMIPAPSTTAGTLDQCFAAAGRKSVNVNAFVETIVASAIQPDGKIVMVGNTSSGTSTVTQDWVVLRLNADGSLDRSFATNGRTTLDFSGGADLATSVLLQSDGKIVVGGYATGITRDFAVARFNADGTLDNGFGTAGKYTRDLNGDSEQVQALTWQTVGATNYIVAGARARYGGTDFTDAVVFRLNASNGSLDTTGFASSATYPGHQIFLWNAAVTGANDLVYGVAIDGSNKIVVGGYNSNFDAGIARLNTNGTLDTTFDGNGIYTTNLPCNIYGMIMQNGKPVLFGQGVVGSSSDQGFYAARFNLPASGTGSLDSTFGSSGTAVVQYGAFTDVALAGTVQNDGKIVLAGYTQSANSINGQDTTLLRLTSNGAIDTTLSSTGFVVLQQSNTFSDQAQSIAIDATGKYVLGGYTRVAASPNNNDDLRVLRVHP